MRLEKIDENKTHYIMMKNRNLAEYKIKNCEVKEYNIWNSYKI